MPPSHPATPSPAHPPARPSPSRVPAVPMRPVPASVAFAAVSVRLSHSHAPSRVPAKLNTDPSVATAPEGQLSDAVTPRSPTAVSDTRPVLAPGSRPRARARSLSRSRAAPSPFPVQSKFVRLSSRCAPGRPRSRAVPVPRFLFRRSSCACRVARPASSFPCCVCSRVSISSQFVRLSGRAPGRAPVASPRARPVLVPGRRSRVRAGPSIATAVVGRPSPSPCSRRSGRPRAAVCYRHVP